MAAAFQMCPRRLSVSHPNHADGVWKGSCVQQYSSVRIFIKLQRLGRIFHRILVIADATVIHMTKFIKVAERFGIVNFFRRIVDDRFISRR